MKKLTKTKTKKNKLKRKSHRWHATQSNCFAAWNGVTKRTVTV